jgi:hypothetical protein
MCVVGCIPSFLDNNKGRTHNFSGGCSPYWVNHVYLCLYCIYSVFYFYICFILFLYNPLLSNN